MAATQTWQPLERDALAARLAQDIPEGWSVNLGIGIPTLVGNYVPPEREVLFHSENGILGMGPAPPPEKINRWLINASSQYVTLRPGASYMSHSDSFALVRGGHLDLCIGAFQVAENASRTGRSRTTTPASAGRWTRRRGGSVVMGCPRRRGAALPPLHLR
jgi:3-oxoadipate CoA-transferase beta subunit